MHRDSSILLALPTSLLVSASAFQFVYGVVRTGTDGADTLTGRGGNDTIYGLGGDDVLRGLGGSDTLYGGGGDDVLWGRDGSDSLFSSPGGNSTLYGGADQDWFFAGGGLDVLYGGPGEDTFYLGQNGSGRDTIYGGVDDDRSEDGVNYINSSAGVYVDLRRVPSADRMLTDVLYGIETAVGSSYNDTIVGNTGFNRLYAESGDDRLTGFSGVDWLYGGYGNDVLFGGTGEDYLDGDDGDDVIHGGRGADTMRGGAGDDQFVFNVQTDIGGGSDRIQKFDGDEDRIVISGLAAGSEAPQVSIFVRPTGVSMVTVGDPNDPLFTIAVEDYKGAITLGDIEFAFLG